MASNFAEAWRSFWHTMTSYDRHASHNSPYRTGQHVPLPQSRQTPLTSVATDASESRTNLASPYTHDDAAEPAPAFANPSALPQSPASPYSPGMRSTMQRTRSSEAGATSLKSPFKAAGNVQEIQMQPFSDGLAPPPPVSHSWKRIDRWAEDNYMELYDNLGEGCTQNDINELEHSLDSTLPQDVRESWQMHDGQERGGRPCGIIFSSMLLDCEEIVQEWHNWQTVNEEYLSKRPSTAEASPPKATDGGPSSSSRPPPPSTAAAAPSTWREELLAKQDSQPPNAIQKAYFHPGWIPLVRDWGGNNLCVDLAPGPAGKWGQVILMGRDYDCKYVVARSWGHLLATMADDLSTSKVFVDEETGDLKLNEFKNAQPAYLDILRWRCDQKHGRRPMPRRRSTGPAARGSPYGSPRGSVDGERGQSPQRFPSRTANNSSPRASGQISSPLARVAEEGPSGIGAQMNGSARKESFPRAEKLVSTENTPRQSVDSNAGSAAAANGSPLRPQNVNGTRDNARKNTGTTAGAQGAATPGHAKRESEDMKTVDI